MLRTTYGYAKPEKVLVTRVGRLHNGASRVRLSFFCETDDEENA